MKLYIKPLHILIACIGVLVFGKSAEMTNSIVLMTLFWICAIFLGGLALFQFFYPIWLYHENTFKNICFVIFVSMINTAYFYNFADIANQNSVFVACCVAGVLLCALAFLLAKLIKEL